MRRVKIELSNGKFDDLSQEEALELNLEERYGQVSIKHIEFYDAEPCKEETQ